MNNSLKPYLLNSVGVPYEEWDGFGVETGFPDDKCLSPKMLRDLADRYFAHCRAILVSGVPPSVATQALGGIHRSVTYIDHRPAELVVELPDRALTEPCTLTILGSLEKLPMAASSFDAAVCLQRLSYLRRPRQAIQELHRVLLPGSIALCDVLTRQDSAYGSGQQLDLDTFVIANTLYRFFNEVAVESLIADLFDVVDMCPMVRDGRYISVYVLRNSRRSHESRHSLPLAS